MLPRPVPLTSIPFDDQESVPDIGQYIAFTLDTIATLLQHADMDDMALKEAAAMSTQQYVGLVTLPVKGYDPWSAACGINLLPISPNLPSYDAENLLEPHMCVPISPTQHHPTGRKAIPTTPPDALPWPSVYHPSFLQFQVIAKNQFVQKPAHRAELDLKDSWDLECQIGKDLGERNTAWMASGKPKPDMRLYPWGCLFEEPRDYPLLHSPPVQSFPSEIFLVGEALHDGSIEEAGEDSNDDRMSSCSSYSHYSTEYSFRDGPASAREDVDEDTGYVMDAIQSVLSISEQPYDSDPVVSVSFDLKAVPELADPLVFLNEIKELNAIMHRSRDRAYERLKETLAQRSLQETCSSRPFSRLSLSVDGPRDTTCAESICIKTKPSVHDESMDVSENDLPAADVPSCFGFMTSWFKARIQTRLSSWSRKQHSPAPLPSMEVKEKKVQTLSTASFEIRKRLSKPFMRRRRRWGVNRRLRLDFDISLS